MEEIAESMLRAMVCVSDKKVNATIFSLKKKCISGGVLDGGNPYIQE